MTSVMFALKKNVEVRLFVSNIPKYILTVIFILATHTGLCVEADQMQNFWFCWLCAIAGSPLGHLPLGPHQDSPQEISPHVTYGCHYTTLST